jgi:single-strand DNA-binding protein
LVEINYSKNPLGRGGLLMASVNKAILIGNLGNDPELRYTPGGQAVTGFRIATTDRWRDKDGQNQQRTEWHNIVAWGRQAEIANEYLKKGSPVYIEGRLQTRSWEDKDGNKRYITEIVTQRMQLLGRRGAEEETTPPPPEAETPESAGGEEDDLPF